MATGELPSFIVDVDMTGSTWYALAHDTRRYRWPW